MTTAEKTAAAFLGTYVNQDGRAYCDAYDRNMISDKDKWYLAERYDNNSDVFNQYDLCTAEYFAKCVENGSAIKKEETTK